MLIPQLGFGGAEKSFIRLANFLCKHHNVTITLFDKKFKGYSGNCATNNLRNEIEIKYLGSLGNIFTRWIKRWILFRKIKKQNDISISFLSGTNLLNAISGTDTYTIISERGSRKYDINQTGIKKILWLKFLAPLTYRYSDKIVTVSEGLSMEIIENRKEKFKNKVVAFEGYIDSKNLIKLSDEPIDDCYAVLKNYPTIVAVGRLSNEKGFDYLIKTFKILKTDIPKAKLLIIGNGPKQDELYQLSKDQLKLKISVNQSNIEFSDVIFAGFKSNPSKYFKLGKVIAFTSITEGLPNVLIEAIASGMHVLASDCSIGVRSIMEVEQKLTLLPHKNSLGTLMPMIHTSEGQKYWVEHLKGLLQNPIQIRNIDTRFDSIKRFDINETGKKWLELIKVQPNKVSKG